jgi:hypothetical protein
MKVDCTWGQGPDIIIELDGTKTLCHEGLQETDRYNHGTVSQGSIDLSAKQARELATQLLKAVAQVDGMEKSLEVYFNEEEREKGEERKELARKLIPIAFETTNNQRVARARVYGGWLVLYFEDEIKTSGAIHRPAMCFVPDPNHEWRVV